MTREAEIPDAPKSLPFGTTDGYGDKRVDPLATFVSFAGPGRDRGVAMRGNDRTVRVIVGKKGAGKSLYLRRLQAAADQEESLYADDIQKTHPRTDDIVRIGGLYPAWDRVERWSLLWRAAILRATVSHLLCKQQLRQMLSDGDELELRQHYPELYPDPRRPSSIYGAFGDICYFYETRRKLDRYLAHPLWNELEYHLAEILGHGRPLCFYIDAIDEKFSQAPRQWIDCQLGLFYQVMALLNDERLGGRLHVVICVRDLVYSHTQNTEHLTRYWGDPHIHVLDWDHGMISRFLAEKLEELADTYFIDPRAERTVESWLGHDSVSNLVKHRKEPLERYLLRHTRLIPRDIVALGNDMCEAIIRAEGDFDERTIRDVVRGVAGKSGREQINVCANQIAAEMMPERAAELGFASFYTGEHDLLLPVEPPDPEAQIEQPGDELGEENSGILRSPFHASLAAQLREAVGTLRHDRVGRRSFDRLRAAAEQAFGPEIDVGSILWQNGLVGHLDGSVEEGQAIFYRADREDELELPRSSHGYALHPILIDTIPDLSGKGEPVYPN